MPLITTLHAREILDSRGNPTVEVELALDGGRVCIAGVPSGASTGIHEAIELRDNDPKRYMGKGVQRAVENVNTEIWNVVKEHNLKTQRELDDLLIQLDGTPNKARLGANAILGVSLAFARASAEAQKIELYQYFGAISGNTKFVLPIPMMNIINGGKHADSGLDFQEFMLIPQDFPNFKERLRAGSEIFHTLQKILHTEGFSTGVGDEGGFAPQLGANEKALDMILRAIKEAGYTTDQVKIGMDTAASSFFKDGVYTCKINGVQVQADNARLIAWFEQLVAQYPIISIEDPLAEDEWDGFVEITKRLGGRITIVGDDLLVTNVLRIKEAIEKNAVNSVLIKINQIGTISETIDAILLTHKNGWKAIVSHRSGETTDTSIADLAVGAGCAMIKTGSLSRSERVAKYDRLLEIEEKIGG